MDQDQLNGLPLLSVHKAMRSHAGNLFASRR